MNNKRAKQLRKIAKAAKKEDGTVVLSSVVNKRTPDGSIIQKVTYFHKTGTESSVYQRLKKAFKSGMFSYGSKETI